MRSQMRPDWLRNSALRILHSTLLHFFSTRSGSGRITRNPQPAYDSHSVTVMAVTTTSESPSQIQADAIVIGVHAESPPAGFAAEFDRASAGLLTRLVEAKEITGKKCETVTLLAPPGAKAGLVIVVGLGPKNALDRGIAFRAASAFAAEV